MKPGRKKKKKMRGFFLKPIFFDSYTWNWHKKCGLFGIKSAERPVSFDRHRKLICTWIQN